MAEQKKNAVPDRAVRETETMTVAQEERDAEALQGLEPEKERPPKNWEFTKGVLFGMLVSAVCVMAVFLMRNGTLQFGRQNAEASGLSALTSTATIEKLQEIADRIEVSYLYEADEDQMVDYLLKGTVLGLDDPYANYYTAEEMEDVIQTSEGAYYGIGIQILKDRETGVFRVAGVYEDSPAWISGIKPDDELIQVNGSTVTGMDLYMLVSMIKKAEGEITLSIMRGEKELEVKVTPAHIEIPTVSSRMIDEEIGYISITEFDAVTVTQFEETLEQMEKAGLQGLIVDVRDNPGGNMDSVCEILDLLLPEGLIVYTENKHGKQEEHYSDDKRHFEKPMAVLVNENSASASEIFAGAIQDYGIGTIIGSQTYGKGVVQRTYQFDDGSALKLTTDKYYTAKGQDIDGKGVTPDIVIEEDEETEREGTDAAAEAGETNAKTEAEDIDQGKTEAEHGETDAEATSEDEQDTVLDQAITLLQQELHEE